MLLMVTVIVAGARAGLEIYEYAPRQVKLAVTGLGGAGKSQVAQMMKALRAFLGGQLQNLAGIAQAERQPVQTGDDLLEFRALPAQFLRALGVVPDSGLLEFAGYFLQALALVVVIKDTSSKSRYAPRDL